MVRKKRERLEIIKDILGIILLNRNLSQVKLIQKSNLSYPVFKGHSQELIQKGLIEEKSNLGKRSLGGKQLSRDKATYNLTELGREFLEDYRAVELFLEKYGLNEE